jgi:predicted MFS family arabinose efflux permease
MAFSILTGVLADVFPRRSVMLAAQAMMFLVSCALVAVSSTGAVTPLLLLVFTFLLGCGTALHSPAWQASIGELVPRDQVSAAVSANILGNNVARAAGPAIGGLLVAAIGTTAAFAFNAVTYLGLIVVLWRWRTPAPERRATRFLPELAAGLRHGLVTSGPRAVFVRALIFSSGAAVIWALMPYLALRLGGGPDLLGLLLGAVGVGGMLGAFVSLAVRKAIGQEGTVNLAALLCALGCLLAGVVPSVALALLGHLLVGTSWVLSLSTFNLSLQFGVERGIVGRQLAIYQTMAFGGLALGSAFWGVVADAGGIAAAYFGAAALLLAGLPVGLRMALPQPLPGTNSQSACAAIAASAMATSCCGVPPDIPTAPRHWPSTITGTPPSIGR